MFLFNRQKQKQKPKPQIPWYKIRTTLYARVSENSKWYSPCIVIGHDIKNKKLKLQWGMCIPSEATKIDAVWSLKNKQWEIHNEDGTIRPIFVWQ